MTESVRARFFRLSRNYFRVTLWFVIFASIALLAILNSDRAEGVAEFLRKWASPDAPRLTL